MYIPARRRLGFRGAFFACLTAVRVLFWRFVPHTCVGKQKSTKNILSQNYIFTQRQVYVCEHPLRPLRETFSSAFFTIISPNFSYKNAMHSLCRNILSLGIILASIAPATGTVCSLLASADSNAISKSACANPASDEDDSDDASPATDFPDAICPDIHAFSIAAPASSANSFLDILSLSFCSLPDMNSVWRPPCLA